MYKPLPTLILLIISFQHLLATENHPAGARSLALSNAYVSISDTWSTFHNQAGLAKSNKLHTGTFYESKFLVDKLSLVAGSIILPVNAGTIGLSFSQFGEGTYKENKFGIAFAKQLSKNIQTGIQLDYFSDRFPENSSRFGYTTFEGGIIYTHKKRLFLGFHIFNPISNGIETPLGKDPSPTIIRFGGHYEFDSYVLITTEIQKKSDSPILLKSGIEFSPVQNLAFRLGISGTPVQYTTGIGYSVGNISTDIGFSYHGNLGITPSVSFQINLK